MFLRNFNSHRLSCESNTATFYSTGFSDVQSSPYIRVGLPCGGPQPSLERHDWSNSSHFHRVLVETKLKERACSFAVLSPRACLTIVQTTAENVFVYVCIQCSLTAYILNFWNRNALCFFCKRIYWNLLLTLMFHYCSYGADLIEYGSRNK